jgi:hypothetical protein
MCNHPVAAPEIEDEFADESLFEFALLILAALLVFDKFWRTAPVFIRDEPYFG